MPYPVPYFGPNRPLAAKTLNISLYADDGSQTGATGTVTGILFLCNRLAFLESILALSPNTITPGVTRLDAPGFSTSTYWSWLDNTGSVWDTGADFPGDLGQYQYSAALPGSAGAGTQVGGWTVYAHFIPLTSRASQTAIGANLQGNGSPINAGSRQQSNPNRDNCAFYLDLLPFAGLGVAVNPAVFMADSGSNNVSVSLSSTDSSGETPRFLSFWGGASTWSSSNNTPTLPAPVSNWSNASTVSAALLNGNTGIADVVNFMMNPPMLRANRFSSQSIPSGANTQVLMNEGLDTFNGYSSGTSTYTVPRDGLYLVHGTVCWNTASAGQRFTGIQVNSTIYWGPGYLPPPSNDCMSTKTQIFSLRAGDTVKMMCRQNTGSALQLDSSFETRMFALWLCAPGTPSTLWTPPDLGFRWPAGSGVGTLGALFQSHLGNDLGFLVKRPYLMAYQTVAQTGLTQNTFSTLTLDTVQGIVHSDAGDNYSFWTSGSNNRYIAQRAGWYLVVGEFFAVSSSGTSSVVAGINTATSGGQTPANNPDWYQHMLASGNAQFPPGATVVGLYYLNSGEYVQPQMNYQDFGGNWSTDVGLANGGNIDSHMEVVWLCE